MTYIGFCTFMYLLILDAYQHMLPGQTRPLAPTPKFIQGKKEKERAFLNRVENATRKVILQSKISDHYGVCIDILYTL